VKTQAEVELIKNFVIGVSPAPAPAKKTRLKKVS
jgi:hypothetical protein